MKKLSRLWRAFERAPGLAAIPAQWQQYCGPDYTVIQPFLKTTDMVGAAYPCPDCRARNCERDIDYGNGEIVAVCRNPWHRRPDIPLMAADTVLHQVDLAALTQAAARPLGIRWQPPVDRGHGTWGIGLAPNEYGIERSVVLMVHTEQERFRCALNRLLADSPEKFLLLAPTDRHRSLQVHEMLLRREIPMQTLEGCLGINQQGRFAALYQGAFPLAAAEPPVEPTPIAERPEKVAGFLAKHGLTIKDVLVALSLDRRDFNRWRNGELPRTSSKSKKIEAYLRTGPVATKPAR
jgi:hypothetical protein